MGSQLTKEYKEKIKNGMSDKFSYKNVMEIPKITKITINRGVGEAVNNAKALEDTVAELESITGQKCVVTKAKKSIAGFKLRAGMPIGAKVTLRGDRMYEFINKLLKISLPRIRDFRGVSNKAFDGSGNYTLGLKEQIIFPEIKLDKIDKIRGFNITFSTTAKTNEETYEIMKIIGMPFRK